MLTFHVCYVLCVPFRFTILLYLPSRFSMYYIYLPGLPCIVTFRLTMSRIYLPDVLDIVLTIHVPFKIQHVLYLPLLYLPFRFTMHCILPSRFTIIVFTFQIYHALYFTFQVHHDCIYLSDLPFIVLTFRVYHVLFLPFRFTMHCILPSRFTMYCM